VLPGILVPLDVNSETGAMPIAFVVNGFCSIKEAIFFFVWIPIKTHNAVCLQFNISWNYWEAICTLPHGFCNFQFMFHRYTFHLTYHMRVIF